MTNFEKWQYYYSKGWAKKAQLKQVVTLGGLTPEEYETITGEPYEVI
jgi:hypothetical protein